MDFQFYLPPLCIGLPAKKHIFLVIGHLYSFGHGTLSFWNASPDLPQINKIFAYLVISIKTEQSSNLFWDALPLPKIKLYIISPSLV